MDELDVLREVRDTLHSIDQTLRRVEQDLKKLAPPQVIYMGTQDPPSASIEVGGAETK